MDNSNDIFQNLVKMELLTKSEEIIKDFVLRVEKIRQFECLSKLEKLNIKEITKNKNCLGKNHIDISCLLDRQLDVFKKQLAEHEETIQKYKKETKDVINSLISEIKQNVDEPKNFIFKVIESVERTGFDAKNYTSKKVFSKMKAIIKSNNIKSKNKVIKNKFSKEK
ncbi:MAG: hypothetical protein WCR30_00165 [Clostridia bacterium]